MNTQSPETTARDVMNIAPTVTPSTSIKELAKMLLNTGLDGACVVEKERLVGVVTAMDLIFQKKRVHLPSFFTFLDALIPLESPSRLEEELRKLAGSTVADIMTTSIRTVSSHTPLDEVAQLMVEHHLTILPVIDGPRLLGMVDKPTMIRVAVGI